MLGYEEEASLFAADLFRMYSRYAQSKGWDVDVMSSSESGIGGFKEIIFRLENVSFMPMSLSCPPERGSWPGSARYRAYEWFRR
jgi:hypothetical protein